MSVLVSERRLEVIEAVEKERGVHGGPERPRSTDLIIETN
jgi:hypothetical protein